jgi:hypothetical protein
MFRRVASQVGLNAARWFRATADRVELFTLVRFGVHIPPKPEPVDDDDVDVDFEPFDPISPEARSMIAKVEVAAPPTDIPLAGSIEERMAKVKAW